MRIEENKQLAPLTTLGIGGPARWFVSAESETDVAEAIAFARAGGMSLFVLGGGSNLLIADAGFDGLVVHIALKGIQVREGFADSQERIYAVSAGEEWDRFVQRTVDDDCAGLECLAGIPGTAGGTPVQNVGAYGQEVSGVIDRVRAFDLHEQIFVEFSVGECAFSYRQSRFNTTDRGRYAVTLVDYRLKLHGTPTLKYADLQKALAAKSMPGLRDVSETVRAIRRSKGMLIVEGDPESRSAGSFFQEPDRHAGACGTRGLGCWRRASPVSSRIGQRERCKTASCLADRESRIC